MPKALLSNVIQFLRGGKRGRGLAVSAILTQQRRAYQQAALITKGFYIFLFFISFNQVLSTQANWQNPETIVPLWPLAWINWVEPLAALRFLMLGTLFGFIVGIYFIEWRWARVIIFLFFFQLSAFANSFGKINHNLHGLIIISLILMLLPNGRWASRGNLISWRHRFLTLFASAQIFFMFFYTMSGLWKIYAGLLQVMRGDLYHTFHPYALAQHVAFRLIQTNSQSLLGDLMIDYPLLGTLPFFLVLYLEIFAVVAAFRPTLHRLWGILMIGFHVGTFLTMTINFNINIVLLGFFLLLSPFQPKAVRLQEILSDLPIVALAFRWRTGPTPASKPKLAP
ncbi:MAG: hypothetical protein AAF633_26965 [Chloroflexota bacterium]